MTRLVSAVLPVGIAPEMDQGCHVPAARVALVGSWQLSIRSELLLIVLLVLLDG